MNPKPLILISSCLLGQNVRFDGGHKRDTWVLNELANFVDFYPVCPEVMMGLGTPRATLRITEDKQGNRKLVENVSNKDFTDLINETSNSIIDKLPKIDGVILTHKSPSCGFRTAKIYEEESGRQLKKGNGYFSEAVRQRLPEVPIIDSGLLNDDFLKENFIRNVYCLYEFSKIDDSIFALQNFHKNLKYLLMEYGPSSVRELGNIAANSANLESPLAVKERYHKLLASVLLSKNPSVKKRINVFSHLLGYFKKDLNSEQKGHILKSIEDYSNGLTTYNSLIDMFSFLVMSYKKEYLASQILLRPYPKTLMQLKNFV